jgi:hypothetical protein
MLDIKVQFQRMKCKNIIFNKDKAVKEEEEEAVEVEEEEEEEVEEGEEEEEEPHLDLEEEEEAQQIEKDGSMHQILVDFKTKIVRQKLKRIGKTTEFKLKSKIFETIFKSFFMFLLDTYF